MNDEPIHRPEDPMVWYPVDQRLPKTSQQVLVTDGKWVTTGYLRDLSYHSKPERCAKWAWGNSSTNNVTHWMPFPEPPK